MKGGRRKTPRTVLVTSCLCPFGSGCCSKPAFLWILQKAPPALSRTRSVAICRGLLVSSGSLDPSSFYIRGTCCPVGSYLRAPGGPCRFQARKCRDRFGFEKIMPPWLVRLSLSAVHRKVAGLIPHQGKGKIMQLAVGRTVYFELQITLKEGLRFGHLCRRASTCKVCGNAEDP